MRICRCVLRITNVYILTGVLLLQQSNIQMTELAESCVLFFNQFSNVFRAAQTFRRFLIHYSMLRIHAVETFCSVIIDNLLYYLIVLIYS